MKQEDKELLLKDLCARLPYRIKASYYDAEDECETWDEIESITLDGYVDIGQYSLPIEAVKPYLLPLSSMTEEQYYEMQTISGKDCLEHMEVEKEWRNNSSFSHLPLYEYRVIDFFIKNHFDYRGLIPMGLAIDASGKNIY